MLTTLLLAGMVAAPLSFTGLVIPVKRHACAAAGRWPAIRRFALAVAATTAVAVAVAASLGLSGISGHDRDAGIAGVVLANLAWLPVTGRWMARAGSELLAEADLVAPVPLHWRRLFMRRYNQAQLLARVAVREAAVGARPRLAPDLLRRRRWTGSQSGLRAQERRGNVRQAFDIHPRWVAEVAGKTVLLVDDVLTTGATVEACTRVLQRGGARHVDVLTLARVVRPAV